MARGDHSKLIVRIELRPWRLRPHMTAYHDLLRRAGVLRLRPHIMAYSMTVFGEQEFCGSGRIYNGLLHDLRR